jgi:hypothetical protein
MHPGQQVREIPSQVAFRQQAPTQQPADEHALKLTSGEKEE